MAVYRKQTEPLVAHYTDRGLVKRIVALGSVDDVALRIQEALS
jgi:adenylate kinase family enzyme